MQISLYVLVDTDGRICYSGSYDDCYEANKRVLSNDCKIIELKGEY